MARFSTATSKATSAALAAPVEGDGEGHASLGWQRGYIEVDVSGVCSPTRINTVYDSYRIFFQNAIKLE